METIKLKAKLIKDILKAVQEAKIKGVKEPVKEVLKVLKAKIEHKIFKSSYNLK
jgi:hypothetical protein